MKARHLGAWMGAVAIALCGLAPVANAAQSDPAAAQIESFDGQLIQLMKDAKSLGMQGRYRRLEPVVARAFDIPTMIRFAVGPTWSSMTSPQQEALTEAFDHLTVASFAHNFSGFSGQHFQQNPAVVTRGPDKVVQTQLISPGDAPVSIMYRMREAGGAWKIVDVYYDGISQLSTRRADFQSSLQKGGAPTLIAHLNALVDKEMK